MFCAELVATTVHKVKKPLDIIILILNILLPGFGTMICAFGNTSGFSGITLVVGLCQLITSGLLVGWIWSVYWGVLIWKRS